MSLMLPRLIDDLEGRVPRSSLIYFPGISQAEIDLFLRWAKQAECFNFGELPLEPNYDNLVPSRSIHGDMGMRHTWLMPELTDVELEAWNEGLIPIPGPVCWYEFTLGGFPTGILTRGNSDEFTIQRVDYGRDSYGSFNGIWIQKEQGDPKDYQKFVALGNANLLKHFQNFWAKRGSKSGTLNLASDYYIAVYLSLMLCSQTTEARTELPPEKLNKARVKRGDYPLPPHRIVTIVPNRFLDRRDGQGGTHASPRLHWRRSHKRHFKHQTANARWLSMEQYNGEMGWWVTIIPRMLVGLPELGTVTHEYRIKQKEKVDG